MLGFEHITEYFKRWEIECYCGCKTSHVDVQSIIALDLFRSYLKKPIHVTSGARCRRHNKKCGGALNSFHIADAATPCQAFDITVIGMTAWDIMQELEYFDVAGIFTGRGVYPEQHFIHIDTGHQLPTRWIKHPGSKYIYVREFIYGGKTT